MPFKSAIIDRAAHGKLDKLIFYLVVPGKSCKILRPKASTRPVGLEYRNPRAHRPTGLCGLGIAGKSEMGPVGGHSGRNWPSSRPVCYTLASPRHKDLRPLRRGVDASQGRWPCADLRPASPRSKPLFPELWSCRCIPIDYKVHGDFYRTAIYFIHVNEIL